MTGLDRSLIAFALLSTLSVPAFAMGGGGGFSSGGNYSNFGNFGSADEYATGLRLIHHEHYADAIPHLNAALQKKPHDADVANYLGFAHRKVGETMTGDRQAQEFDASMRFYQYALQFDPDHKGVHEYLGELYLDMHDPASANQELAKLSSLCPSGCDEHDTLAQAIAKAGPVQTAPLAAQAASQPAPQTSPQN